jgi:hypothetical protein
MATNPWDIDKDFTSIYGEDEEDQAVSEPSGFAVPTDESLNTALDNTFANIAPRLRGNPTFGDLQWEQPSAVGGTGGTDISPWQEDTEFEDIGWSPSTPKGDDYGYGISNALMRGLVRAGQLIDLAQEDWEEYAKGEEALKQYGLSEEDQARMAELGESEGLWDVLGYFVKNPSLAAQITVESLPMSAATLVGGAVGTAIGGPVLGGLAAGTGSGLTEYLASLSEAFAEANIDPTNPEQLKAAYANEEIMGRAREIGAKRGLGIGIWDAISMGLAGRIYKPVSKLTGAAEEGASLARRAGGKTLGGLSETLAQGVAGGAGEFTGQMFAGQEYDPVAVGSEIVGEVLPGGVEIAIGALNQRGKQEAAPEPTEDLGMIPPGAMPQPPTTPPPTTPPPTTPPEDTGGAGEAIPTTPPSAIDLEAEDQIVQPPSEPTQATTPETTPKPPAPEAQKEDELSQAEIEQRLAEFDKEEEAREQARLEEKEAEGAEPTEADWPIITIKDMAPKLTGTFQGVPKDPVRTAWKGVIEAIAERYSDVDLPSPKGAFTGTGLARFFKKLQEDVDVTKDIPELKELLTQISEEKTPADVIKVLGGIAGKIRDETPSLTENVAPGSVAAQVQSEYNNFVPWLNKRRGEAQGKTTKGQATVKGTPKRIVAEKLGQFAAAVRDLVNEADRAGVIEMEGSGLGANYGRTIESAFEAMDAAMAPIEKKTKLKSGDTGKALTINWRSDSLVKIADELIAIAENLTPKLAAAESKAAEAKAKAKKGKGEAKVEAKKPVTEAPAKPKPETPGQKARKKAKAANRQAEKAAAEKAAAEKPAAKKAKEAPAAEEDTRSYQELRKRAKELGIDTTGKKPELLARVQKAEKNPKAAKRAAESVKEQAKEVERQKKLVPARYRGKKYFFHAVANDEDIGKIISEGLRPGTNVSRIGGQALSGEGDTILVFEGKPTEKGYQADQLAVGGERPIAIIKDTTLEEREGDTREEAALVAETEAVMDEIYALADEYGANRQEVMSLALEFDSALAGLKKSNPEIEAEGRELGLTPAAIKKLGTLGEKLSDVNKKLERIIVNEEVTIGEEPVTEADVLERYRKFGVSVYSTRGTKVKPDVAGADPNAVLNPEPKPRRGVETANKKKLVEAETWDQALEQAGVKKQTDAIINGLKDVLAPEQFENVVGAVYDYLKHKDLSRLTAQVQDVVGDTPLSGQVLEAITDMALAFEENKAIRDAQIAEDAKLAEEDWSEDDRELLGLTGQGFDPTEQEGVDEWNVPWGDRLRSVLDLIGDKYLHRKSYAVMSDNAVLDKAFAKIRKNLEIGKNYGMQEFIDVLYDALPNNHRFAFLLKQIKSTRLDLKVNIKDVADVITGQVKAEGKVVAPASFNPKVNNPDTSFIDVSITPERTGKTFIRSALHELTHAVTFFRYMTEPRFKEKIDKLWLQSVEQTLGKHDAFDMQRFKILIRSGNTTGASNFVIDFLTSEPGDIPNFGGRVSLETLYGLSDPIEFIAEAFTNLSFQHVLAKLKVERPQAETYGGLTRASNFLKVFINTIKKTLNISTRNSVLEEVLVLGATNFDNSISYIFAKNNMWLAKNSLVGIGRERGPPGRQPVVGEDGLTEAERAALEKGARFSGIKEMAPLAIKAASKAKEKKVKNNITNTVADAARGRENWLRTSLENAGQALKDLPEKTNLGFMSRDQIERKYRDLFSRAANIAKMATNPLRRYITAKQEAGAIARKYAERASKSLEKLQKYDNATRTKIFNLMRDTTLYQVWPHVSLQDKLNDHLWGEVNKKTGRRQIKPEIKDAALQVRRDYEALKAENPEAAKSLLEMAALTKEIQDAKRVKSLALVAKGFDLEPALANSLANVKTIEDLHKLFKDVYDGKELMEKGEYPADLIYDKDKDSKEQKVEKQNKRDQFDQLRSVARSAESIVDNTSIKGPYFPLRRYGDIVVASSPEWNAKNEPYVSFHNSKWEAARVQKALQEELGMPTKLARKIETTALSADMETVVSELKARIVDESGNNSIHGKINSAMLEVLAENTAYASALKRYGVDGIAAEDMGRAFEEYVFVTKYTLGDLETTYEISEAFKDMRRLQRITEDSQRLPDEARDRIGLVVNELAEQNKEELRDREMSKMQKAIGTIGFFNFLGAPSYWVLNATQTITVTLPYISGKWGVGKGFKAYQDASATIYNAAKGVKSYEEFKANLPEDAQRVVKRLEDMNVLQATIASEFGDIFSPSFMTKVMESAGGVGRAANAGLKLMETIPETVEKFNRISTALAIYKLSDGSIQEVVDGVQATQFNYDSANRARLLKAAPKWAGGGLRPIITPIMMFKTYGVGLMRLLYGNAIRSVIGKTPQERAEARKIAGGLIATHSVFGGFAGGIMMAPVQVLVDIFNTAFREAGDEFDPEEALELFLTDVAGETTAALFARGLPAAVGVDMSKSINLGNLLWLGNDRIYFADSGGVEQFMAMLMGPVAQFGIGAVREGARLWNDDPRGNLYDFIAATIPLKMARGFVRGMKYEMQGVGTDTLTWMEPDEVSGWIRMTLGFRPTGLGMVQDYEYNKLARETRQGRRKSALINKALRAETGSERAEVWEEIQTFNRTLDRKDWIRKGDVYRLKSQRRSRQRQYDRERR